MSNVLDLSFFIFLLMTSSFVSGQHSSDAEENQPNVTVSISKQQYNNATELQPTRGPPQTTALREKPSATVKAPTLGQNITETAHSQPSEGNGTSENFNTQGIETYENQPAGNESFGSTESPTQTQFSVTNGSLDLTVLSSGPTSSTSVATRHRTNATISNPTMLTTPHMGTDGPLRAGTMLSPTTEIRTTQSHTVKPHSTKKPEKSTTKLCPTVEPKRQALVGQCLMAIASLAAVATIFIVTTVILATKLAGSRYRHRASLLHDTEMVCISALMNDSDHPIPTPKHPKSNGALIPITEDDDGDDLTLNSFLHDTEGMA